MKKLYVLMACFQIVYSHAQLTISNIIFYEPGDTIIQNIDNNPTHVVITPGSGTKQNWDFSGLKADNKRRDTIQAIPKSDTVLKSFPTAVMKQPFQNNGFEYLDLTSTEVRGLGVATNFFGQVFIQPYSGKRIVQFAPISYNSTKTGTSTVGFAFDAGLIPFIDSLLKNIVPIPGATIDSIRISTVTRTDFIADAFGEVKTPYEKVEVLRVKQENRVSSKLEAKAKLGLFSFWQDISGLIPIPLPKDTSFVYHFYNNKVKDPVLSIQANKNNQPLRTYYRANPTVPQDTAKPVDTTKKDTIKTAIFNHFDKEHPIQSIVHTDNYIQLQVKTNWLGSTLQMYTLSSQSLFNPIKSQQETMQIKISDELFNQPLIWKWTKDHDVYIEKRMLRQVP